MTRDQALAVLGLDASATSSEVLETYSDLCKVWQPERFDDDERLKCKALEKMQLISDAYACLSQEQTSEEPNPANASSEEYAQAFERHVLPSIRSRRLNDGRLPERPLRLIDFIPLFPFLLAFFVISISAGAYVGTLLFRGVLSQRSNAEPSISQGVSFREFKQQEPLATPQPEPIVITEDELDQLGPGDATTDIPLPPDLPALLEKANPELLQELMGEEVEEEEADLDYKDRDRLYTLAGEEEAHESYINYTPDIVNAALLCKPGRVKKLIEKGEDLGSVDSQGNSALIWAVRQRCRSVVRLLLKAGADPNTNSANGFSAYVWARLYQSEEIMTLLQDAGADTTSGRYWWRNSREEQLAWIEQSLKRLCANGRCQRWASEEYLRKKKGRPRD